MFKEVDFNKNFVIGTPLVAWKVEQNEHDAWLSNYDDIKKMFPNVQYFAALELDHRGLEPYREFVNRLNDIGVTYWTYSINDFETTVTSQNRWIRIETGRNLVREYAQRGKVIGEFNEHVVYDAILYVDSDVIMYPDAIKGMFEIDRSMVGVDVPSYGLTGELVNRNPRIEEHWTTAGALLVNAPACWDLPWYHNIHIGLSDDPTFQYLGARLYGQTWVRKDLELFHIGKLIPVEHREIPQRVIDNDGH